MINLTEIAAQELDRMMEDVVCYLRIGVQGGGCSGFNYRLSFDDNIQETDQVFESHGIKILCDPKSFLYINGTTIDFESSLMGRGFKFKNPNASNSCGCGESFGV